jgi:tRNA pseudouridine55 synthase
LSYQEPILTFKIACTKGTYVRVLAEDLGKKLGCGAHLHSLRRTKSGSFEIESASTLDQVKSFTVSQLSERVIPYLKLVQTEVPA